MDRLTSPALRTDFYQLTMMQGYLLSGMEKRRAVFDYFIRSNPFEGGYTILAGVGTLLDYLESISFLPEEIEYLRTLGVFQEDFLKYLKNFRFRGDIYSLPEGTLFFPTESVIRVHGTLAECQLIETPLLNIINFQSLIATKSARICREAGWQNVMEFGLRRAQGPDGGLSATRAAYIGGAASTSNVEAGRLLQIPVVGTHAHSWVTAFPDELSAFRRFAELYPDKTTLLVDTYDTLKSGIPHAIQVARELEQHGKRLNAIRIDSGDLAYLSIESRRMLDEAGLHYVKIVASNEMDEYVVQELNRQNSKIDLYGVGTRMVTGMGDPALAGVYKLAAVENPDGNWSNRMKLSESLYKSNFPGKKQLYRLRGADNLYMGDLMEVEDAVLKIHPSITGVHPFINYRTFEYKEIKDMQPLLRKVMTGGRRVEGPEVLSAIRQRVQNEMTFFHPGHLRLLNPHVYKVSLAPELTRITTELRKKLELQRNQK